MRSRLMMLLVGLGAIACATAGPAATPGTQSQATNDSRRAELYPKVSKYLSDAVALEPAYLSPQLHYPTEGVLIGWRDKVCPRLTGLPRQDGVLVLTRVLAVARAAGVRMGDKHCSPNLYIFVTSQPEELVKGLEKQNSYEMFGPRGVPYLLDQFVDTPRPVRVWYNIYGRRGPMATFTRVIVIVNETRLQGVNTRPVGRLHRNGGSRGNKAWCGPGQCPVDSEAVRWRPGDRARRHERLGSGLPEISLFELAGDTMEASVGYDGSAHIEHG
jgi:hypothetical protein